MDIKSIAKNAKNAFLKTMNLSNEIKNEALAKIAKKIEQNKNEILKANELDLKQAEILLQNNEINKATYDRLKLNEAKIRDLIQGLNDLIKLENPVNKVLFERELNEGLILKKKSNTNWCNWCNF